MAEQFLTFQQFSSIEQANDLAERLSLNEIESRIEKLASILDSNIAGISYSPDFLIKLKSSDFIRAHQVLADYYKEQVGNVDKDYYLFDFSNDELLEIIAKPDEWGPLDYQLTQKILRDRGKEIKLEEAQKLKDKRIEELSKPEKGDSLVVVGSLFCGYALLISFLMYTTGNYSFPYSVIIIILIGRYLANNKRVLPNGKQVFSFDERDRKKGDLISFVGFALLLYSLIIWLAIESNYSFNLFEYNYFK